MKAFKFKLESVKRIRESEEKSALDSYAKAMQKRHVQEEHLERLKTNLREAESLIVSRRKMTVSASDLHADRNATMAIRMQINQAEADLEEYMKAEDTQRETFLQAKSQREILDRLEEKEVLEHEQKVRKEEEKEIEDLVVSRYARSSGNSLVS